MPGVVVGRDDLLTSFKSRSVGCSNVSSDKEACKRSKELIPQQFFTFVQLKKYENSHHELMTPQEKQVKRTGFQPPEYTGKEIV